jgi:hypothetical protein
VKDPDAKKYEVCSHCGTREDLVVRSVSRLKSGIVRKRYMCRTRRNEMMREVMRKWTKTPKGQASSKASLKKYAERKRLERKLQQQNG